jgi:serine O-acetyltransferase
MFETIRADFNRYFDLLPKSYGWWKKILFYLNCQGMWAIADYRFRRWIPSQPRLIRAICLFLSFPLHILTTTMTGIVIPTGCKIGKGLYIGHFSGIFLHDDVELGEECALSQGVSIGLGGKGEKLGTPKAGNRVYFGPGCKVFGKITIGDNARIGANAVLMESVPSGITAVGVPAKPVTKKFKRQ